MNYSLVPSSIKAWAEEDRPREKLLSKGVSSLSNSELFAIILSSGSKNLSAVELAKVILDHYENDLHLLARSSVQELLKFKGIGEAKAISIMACLEIGRRKQMAISREKPKIQSSQDAYVCFLPYFSDLRHEVFRILLLNRQNKLIKIQTISSGGVAGTVVDPKIIFKEALDHLASSLILCHNHPSGNLKPSQADMDITKKLKKAGELMDIKVLDHLIIANQNYFSFADEGLF